MWLQAEKDVKDIYKQKSQLEQEVEHLTRQLKLMEDRFDEATKAAEESER